VDLEPPNISQPWRNNRKCDHLVDKSLYRLLVEEDMLANPWIIKLLVTVGGIYDHMTIMLNIEKGCLKPLTPLKFNHDWMKENDFGKLIADAWTHLRDIPRSSYMHQMVINIKHSVGYLGFGLAISTRKTILY
jgi:hypothetical protein